MKACGSGICAARNTSGSIPSAARRAPMAAHNPGGPIGILKEQRPDHAPGLAPQRPAHTQVQHEPRLPAAHVQFRRPHDQPGRLRQPPFRAVPSGQPYQHRGKSYPAPPVVAVHVRLADARLLDKQLQVIAHQPEDRMPPHGRGKIHAPARSEQPGLPAHALFVVDGRFAVADVADAPRDVPRGRERPAIPPHARVFKAFHLIEARPGHIHGEEFGQARQDAEREQERQPLGADFRPPGREYRKQRRIPRPDQRNGSRRPAPRRPPVPGRAEAGPAQLMTREHCPQKRASEASSKTSTDRKEPGSASLGGFLPPMSNPNAVFSCR